jgi:hypothetical protein
MNMSLAIVDFERRALERAAQTFISLDAEP